MKALSLKDLTQVYADVRSEFNKLISISHSHIVECIGFCVMSLSFVLELAPCGSLRNIIERNRRSGYYICPNSLVEVVKQVEITLYVFGYIHTLHSRFHFDFSDGLI